MNIRDDHTVVLFYGLPVGLSLFLLLSSAGGGVWGQEGAWITQWQHRIFQAVCHQAPDRSFWMGGQPMAVCSRCFGIYGGVFLGLLAGPLFTERRLWSGKLLVHLLIAFTLLNVGDLLGNMLAFWQNTLAVRFGLGGLLGVSAALVISFAFVQTVNRKKRSSYGPARTIQ